MPRLVAVQLATAITVAPSGTIYLTVGATPPSAAGVYSLAGGNTLVPVATAGFSDRMPGIVAAGDGNLYVSDLSNSVIKQVTPAGAVPSSPAHRICRSALRPAACRPRSTHRAASLCCPPASRCRSPSSIPSNTRSCASNFLRLAEQRRRHSVDSRSHGIAHR
jgi:hypothetical protein